MKNTVWWNSEKRAGHCSACGRQVPLPCKTVDERGLEIPQPCPHCKGEGKFPTLTSLIKSGAEALGVEVEIHGFGYDSLHVVIRSENGEQTREEWAGR